MPVQLLQSLTPKTRAPLQLRQHVSLVSCGACGDAFGACERRQVHLDGVALAFVGEQQAGFDTQGSSKSASEAAVLMLQEASSGA